MIVKIDRLQFANRAPKPNKYRVYASAKVDGTLRRLHFDLDADMAQAVMGRDRDKWLKAQFRKHKFKT